MRLSKKDGYLKWLWQQAQVRLVSLRRVPIKGQYIPQDICNKLAELAEIADYFEVMCETVTLHPQSESVRSSAPPRSLPDCNIARTFAFNILEHALIDIKGLPPVHPEDRPFNRRWCTAHKSLFDAVVMLQNFINSSKISAPAHLTSQYAGTVRRRSKGPSLREETLSLFEKMQEIEKAFNQVPQPPPSKARPRFWLTGPRHHR